MPELPEVETVVRGLQALRLPGRRIQRVWLDCPSMVAPLAPAEFARRLQGRRITGVARRAKYIVISLSGGWTLLGHLRMTGQLAALASGAPRDRHQHLVIGLDRGLELRCRDTRKFGRWLVTDDPGAILSRLGPEPLSRDFSAAWLRGRLRHTARRLKPLLLDQAFLAGLGNIYVDEALWAARLGPMRRADSLTAAEAARLRLAIRRVLSQGIRHGGTTLGEGLGNFKLVSGRQGGHQRWLQVFHRAGRPCRRCGAVIQRLVVAQRGTHICPVCQNGNH